MFFCFNYYFISFFSHVICFIVFLFFFSLIAELIFFFHHTNKYPLNNLTEYRISPSLNPFFYDENMKNYTIAFKENEGTWVSQNAKNPQVFDLKGYLFPEKYIEAFYVRHFQFREVNVRKIPLLYFVVGKIKIQTKNQFTNLSLIFQQGNKSRIKILVKDNVLKSDWIIRKINQSKFWVEVLFPHGTQFLLTFREMSEEWYREIK